MRYKSLPLSARNPAPPRHSDDRPVNPRPRRRWLDWLLTIPIVLLIPALVVPYLATGQRTPTLMVRGAPVPGNSLTATGTDFPSATIVQLAWDGSSRAWLPAPTTDRSGTFSARIVLPTAVALGRHTLLARAQRSKGNSNKPTIVAASTSITVVSASAKAPTPAPKATPAPAPALKAPTAALPLTVGSYLGYGSSTGGGIGGTVRAVTNLNDSGTGSLRAALQASGARIVVFSVSGTIALSADLKIKNPYVTVAGETAPGSGIVIRNGAFKVNTHDVILRNMRLRPGDQVASPADVDALTLNGVRNPVYNVVVDHVSMVWGPDIGGLAVLGNVHDVTVSNSIMGEGLYLSAHPGGTASQGGHSMAANITQLDAGLAWPTRITFWQDLFTTSDHRMPRFQGAECMDVVDNVIYNWGIHAAQGNPRSVNLVNNWYRSGPETSAHDFWAPQKSVVAPTLFGNAVYAVGNHADGFTGSDAGSPTLYSSTVRCGGLSVTPETPQAAYDAVIAGAGAILPVRDVVDQRIIANVINRTGVYFNGAGYPGPNPYYP